MLAHEARGEVVVGEVGVERSPGAGQGADAELCREEDDQRPLGDAEPAGLFGVMAGSGGL